MKQVQVIALILATALVMTVGLVLITGGLDEDERMTVTVTLPWQKEMVDVIGGGNVKAVNMVGPGSDPHISDDTTVSNVLSAHDSLAYLYIGTGMEWEAQNLPVISESLPGLMMFNVSQGIVLQPLGAGFNEHVWTLPENLLTIANNTKEALIALDPENESVYVSGHQNYTSEVLRIEGLADDLLTAGNDFLVYHTAWGYLSEQYGLTEISLKNEFGGELTAEDVADCVDWIEVQNSSITTMFVRPIDPVWDEGLKGVFNDKGIEIVIADPLAPDWLQELENFIIALAESWDVQ